MKKEFQEQLAILTRSSELDIATLSSVYGISKALIKKLKPEFLKDINALNPQPDDFNLPAVRHTRIGLTRILNGIIKEYDIESIKRIKQIKTMSYSITKPQNDNNVIWSQMHYKIVELSKKKFEDGHYADSVETALKEINDIVKEFVRKKAGREYDGSDLMNNAFSPKNPIIILDDLSTETGQNIQKGYMQIFSGAMTGIRNPKTHKNIKLSPEKAIQLLFFCSLLFYKLEDGKVI